MWREAHPGNAAILRELAGRGTQEVGENSGQRGGGGKQKASLSTKHIEKSGLGAAVGG